MKNLAQIQQDWLDSYFINVVRVWSSWRDGAMSMKERDETLMWYRRKLWELRQAKNRELVLQVRKPRREDEWLEGIEI